MVGTIPGNDARRVRFIDTPGLQFVRAASSTDGEREAMRARDILLRCRGRIDRLKDPLFGGMRQRSLRDNGLTVRLVTHIVTRGDTQDLMLAYNLPAFLQGDVAGFLAGLARVSGLIKKVGKKQSDVRYGTLMAGQRGVLDHAGAARIVLRDWGAGKLMRYTMPGGASEESSEGDVAVLEAMRSRRELRSRAEVKLVKMDAGASDKRNLEWDVGWGDEEEEEEREEEREEEEDPGRVLRRKVSFVT